MNSVHNIGNYKYYANREVTMTAIEVAKIYVRHNTAIISLTIAIMYGAYLSQIPETIWAAYIFGVGSCVYLDKKSAEYA